MFERNENERQLNRGLDALAASLRPEAPAAVKTRLRAEFRRHASLKRRLQWIRMSAAAALTSLLLLLLWQMRAPRTVGAPVGPAVAKASALPVQAAAGVAVAHARKKPIRPVRTTPVFIALDDIPVESGFVVRVKTDEVEADVLLGEDGRAHAIRFLR
jgi:hypothetical protein